MELCKKQKVLSQLPAGSLKFIFNFQHFEKKMSLMGPVFRNYRPRKMYLNKSLKCHVSGQSWTFNMLNVPKYS